MATWIQLMMADLVRPLLQGEADYAKGNRFYDLTYIGRMPPMRLFGNSVLLAAFQGIHWLLGCHGPHQ